MSSWTAVLKSGLSNRVQKCKLHTNLYVRAQRGRGLTDSSIKKWPFQANASCKSNVVNICCCLRARSAYTRSCPAFAKDLATKFHKHGIWFYKLKEKLALTKDDIAERLPWFLVAAFAKHLATKSLGRLALAGMTASAKQMKPG